MKDAILTPQQARVFLILYLVPVALLGLLIFSPSLWVWLALPISLLLPAGYLVRLAERFSRAPGAVITSFGASYLRTVGAREA